MADLVFYTNPHSRGRIARWMLEEVGERYETQIVPYDRMKSSEFLAINPMGKVPAISHRGKIVTECAAICTYLANSFPAAGLGPEESESADFYRWLFYAAGPLEQALTNNAAGWEPAEDQRRMFGYGTYGTVVAVLDELLSQRRFVCGERFTAADVYLGSHVMWGMQFGTLPQRDSFAEYARRLEGREALRIATVRDEEAQAKLQSASQPHPA